jgi:hypothetical protein
MDVLLRYTCVDRAWKGMDNQRLPTPCPPPATAAACLPTVQELATKLLFRFLQSRHLATHACHEENQLLSPFRRRLHDCQESAGLAGVCLARIPPKVGESGSRPPCFAGDFPAPSGGLK